MYDVLNREKRPKIAKNVQKWLKLVRKNRMRPILG